MRTKLSFSCRAVAALMVGLILLLVIGGASPAVHDHLCAHHQGDAGADHCVINAFSNGEGYAAPLPVLVAPYTGTVEATLVAAARGDFQSAEFDLPPACGPPSETLNPS